MLAQAKLTDVDLLQALCRRLTQQQQVKSRSFTRLPGERLTLECHNSQTLTWAEVYNNLELMTDGVISALEMSDLAMVFEETLCISLHDMHCTSFWYCK